MMTVNNAIRLSRKHVGLPFISISGEWQVNIYDVSAGGALSGDDFLKARAFIELNHGVLMSRSPVGYRSLHPEKLDALIWMRARRAELALFLCGASYNAFELVYLFLDLDYRWDVAVRESRQQARRDARMSRATASRKA